MKQEFTSKRLDRRAAIKWMLAATAVVPFIDAKSFGKTEPLQVGYGTDPNLMTGEVPWDRIMTPEQLRTTTVLADIILPHASKESPSASEVKVPDFMDEWISAPYENQMADRKIIVEGLAWIDSESQRRYAKDFHQLDLAQQNSICDDICYPPDTRPEYQFGAKFFSKFRNLTLGGYYTTDIGMKDVGYVGNVPLASFEGPPPEVLKKLGIEKAPW
jgi:hypothetical protein